MSVPLQNLRFRTIENCDIFRENMFKKMRKNMEKSRIKWKFEISNGANLSCQKNVKLYILNHAWV